MALTVGMKGDFTLQEVSKVICEAPEYNERVAKYKIKVSLANSAAGNGICSHPRY